MITQPKLFIVVAMSVAFVAFHASVYQIGKRHFVSSTLRLEDIVNQLDPNNLRINRNYSCDLVTRASLHKQNSPESTRLLLDNHHEVDKEIHIQRIGHNALTVKGFQVDKTISKTWNIVIDNAEILVTIYTDYDSLFFPSFSILIDKTTGHGILTESFAYKYGNINLRANVYFIACH